MTRRFLLDANVTPKLIPVFRRFDCEVVHVTEILPGDAHDADIARKAAAEGMAVVSNDRDFVALQVATKFPAFVWIRTGNLRRVALADYFERHLPSIIDAIRAGETLIELR